MTPIYIDFAEKRNWRWILASALLGCSALISTVVWRAIETRQMLQLEARQYEDLQAKVRQLKVPTIVKVDPQQQSKAQAASLLSMDLNGMFVAVENLKLPGVHLTSIAFDAGANKLQLDYDVDTLAKAAQVTEMLNAGDDSRPWRMGSVVTIGSSPALDSGPLGAVSVQSIQGAGFKAMWTYLKK